MTDNTLIVPRVTGDVTAYNVAEGNSLTFSDMTFGAYTLRCHKIIAAVKINDELWEDSAPIRSLVETP